MGSDNSFDDSMQPGGGGRNIGRESSFGASGGQKDWLNFKGAAGYGGGGVGGGMMERPVTAS